jgi:Family of unknown function (DUF6283)
MTAIVRPLACDACPYRRNSPSGLWSAEDYAKLVRYDRPTEQQPPQWFLCHATNRVEGETKVLCNGWAIVHSRRGHAYELLALRLLSLLVGREIAIPEPRTPLFDSGTAAAKHGLARIKRPGGRALRMQAELKARYARLRES